MKILITGGAGFIGSHTAELFAGEGHDVVIVDNFSTGDRANLAAVETLVDLHDMDILDTKALSSICEGVEVILHLAAVSSVVKSLEEPLATHQVNTSGFLSVMQAASENGVGRVILSSSAAVYGNDASLPKTETSPVLPLSPYAWHKLTSEFYGETYRKLYGIDFLSLRYFNVYGPRQDPASPYSGALSIFVDKARRNKPLTIYGDGEQTRDFIHVRDVAYINLLAAQAAGPLPDIINIATGKETKIIEVARSIQAACDSGAGIVHAPGRAGDIRRSYAASTLMVETFGSQPLVDIKTGLASLIES